MTAADLKILLESWAFWFIAWSIFAPVISALAVAAWYEWRYREPLADWRKLMKGLRRQT